MPAQQVKSFHGNIVATLKDPDREAQIRSGQSYNVPLRIYEKPDGEFVLLPGEMQNRSYYTDTKNFRLLTPEEESRWLEDTYPRVLAEQKAKAAIVSNIREIAGLVPQARVPDRLSEKSIDQLMLMFVKMEREYGKLVQVFSDDVESALQAAGRSLDEFRAAFAEAADRDMTEAATTGRKGVR